MFWKEEAMTDRSRKTDLRAPRGPALSDERSWVRVRASVSPAPGHKSDPNFSLDQRLEKKLALAQALLARLEPNDARSRLLHIALLRRDESLLDGILAELAAPARATRSR